MTAVVDELAALLAAHADMPCGEHSATVNAWWAQCEGCDWKGPRRSNRASREGDHIRHVAEVIAGHFAAVTAERDAAVAKVAAVEVAVRAAEWRTASSLSRDFTGRPFESLVPLADLRAALDTQPTATKEPS